MTMTKRQHSRQQSRSNPMQPHQLSGQQSHQQAHSNPIQHPGQQSHIQPVQQAHTATSHGHYRPAAISIDDLVTAPQYYTGMTSTLPAQTHYTYQGGPVLHPQYTYDTTPQAQLYTQHPAQQTSHLMPPHSPTPTNTQSNSSNSGSQKWHPEDDIILLKARQEGMGWKPIAKKYFPHRGDNSCRKHHERLMERRKADDWDGLRLEKMASEYMNMRKEIWAPLAARTGEKWTTVEAKCMASGLKNLQSSARAAERRKRLSDSHTIASGSSEYGHGYDAHTPNSATMGFGVDDVNGEYDGHNGIDGDLSHHQTSHMGGEASYGTDLGGGTQYDNGQRLPGNDMDGSAQYNNGQRLPSMDMGIDAIINRDALHRDALGRDGMGREPVVKRTNRRQQ